MVVLGLGEDTWVLVGRLGEGEGPLGRREGVVLVVVQVLPEAVEEDERSQHPRRRTRKSRAQNHRSIH